MHHARRLPVALALALLVGMGAMVFVIDALKSPETNLCGTFCDPAYLQYPGSPDASPCLVVNEGTPPPEWAAIRLCYPGRGGRG